VDDFIAGIIAACATLEGTDLLVEIFHQSNLFCASIDPGYATGASLTIEELCEEEFDFFLADRIPEIENIPELLGELQLDVFCANLESVIGGDFVGRLNYNLENLGAGIIKNPNPVPVDPEHPLVLQLIAEIQAACEEEQPAFALYDDIRSLGLEFCSDYFGDLGNGIETGTFEQFVCNDTVDELLETHVDGELFEDVAQQAHGYAVARNEQGSLVIVHGDHTHPLAPLAGGGLGVDSPHADDHATHSAHAPAQQSGGGPTDRRGRR